MSEEFNVDEIENFVNSELVTNEDIFAGYIKGSFRQSFMINDFLEYSGIETEDMSLSEDIPTIVVFGSYSNPEHFVSMIFTTFDPLTLLEEDISETIEKFQKHIFRMKNIIVDMDFCMISYPILCETDEFCKDSVYKYGLETIIFNPEGFLGGAVSKRTASNEENIHLQFLLPDKNFFTYKDIENAHNKETESRLYARVLKEFYQLPSFASEDSLNELVNEIKKDRIKVITHSESIKKELKDKVASLPLDNFVLWDIETTSSEEWSELLVELLARSDVEREEVRDLIQLVKNFMNSSKEEE